MANKKETDIVDDIKVLDEVLGSTNTEADYSPENIKKDLALNKVEAEETINVQNPVTGKVTEVTIQRDGTPESKLIVALADPKLTRDQKDHTLSMYLFERGKDNASFMVDIMRYKGQHTKETRAFKSQMRFDFEMFIATFTRHMTDSSEAIAEELGYSDFRSLATEYVEWVKGKKKDQANEKARGNDTDVALNLSVKTFFLEGREEIVSVEVAAMLNLAFRQFAEADLLTTQTKSVAEARMKEKGFGIYIDTSGKPYTIFDNDVIDVVKKDKERIEELQADQTI